ncbi:hypothetical protein IX51_02960 [uncultured archaeon]|nr:hypothetical protein IX51_02960 [uncultured archaeon]
MNRILFLAGVSLFIVGISLISVSLVINPYFHGKSSKIHFSSNYTKQENGLYVIDVPPKLTNQESDMMFVPKPSSGGVPGQFALVPQSDLSHVNASNFRQYNVEKPYNNTVDIYFNNVKSGSYAFVEPENDVIAFTITPSIPLMYSGYLSSSGGISAFIGFVTILVSLFMKRRAPPINF